jgi:hypothetical protein
MEIIEELARGEKDFVCCRTLIVSKGCPTITPQMPEMLPASASTTALRAFDDRCRAVLSEDDDSATIFKLDLFPSGINKRRLMTGINMTSLKNMRACCSAVTTTNYQPTNQYKTRQDAAGGCGVTRHLLLVLSKTPSKFFLTKTYR